MLFTYLRAGKEGLIMLLLSLPIIMFSLSFHEMAHGYIANKMGDPTAKNLGRLTLNPLKHLDPMGAIAMLVFGYGWAKPVPIVTRNFKDPRMGMALTGIAGPISNMLLGIVSCLLHVGTNAIYSATVINAMNGENAFNVMAQVSSHEGIFGILYTLTMFFYISALLNFSLALFNMIPVPPFDGSRFFYIFLPTKLYFKVMKYEQTIMIAVLLAFLLLSRSGYSPISIGAEWLTELFSGLFSKLFVLVSSIFT